MKRKIRVIVLIVFILSLFAFWLTHRRRAHAQTSLVTLGPISSPTAGAGNSEVNSSTQFHQLTWRTSGVISTCTVALDSSVDGVSWSAGGVITGQTCTSNGTSTIVNSVVNFVRINTTVLSGGGTVTVIYTGFNTNPAGGVAGPGSSTTNDIPTFNGTTGATLQDPVGATLTSSALTLNSGVKVASSANGTGNSIGWPTEIFYSNATRDLRLQMSAVDKFQWTNGPFILDTTTGVVAWGIGGADTGVSRDASTAKMVNAGNGTVGDSSGIFKAAGFSTSSNCAQNSVSPAACGSASSGVIVVPTTTTTYTINTTAVGTNSRIFLQAISDNTGIPSAPTCTALAVTAIAMPSARSAGTSFTFVLPSTVGTTCFNYWIVN